MAVTKNLAVGLLLVGGTLAAGSGCAAQNTFSGFEISPHGGAYFSPYELPGGEAEGLYWGFSETQTYYGVQNYCDRICPSSFPYQLYFKGDGPIENNYISIYSQATYQYYPVDNFQVFSFDFGCTRLQPYKFSNGTTATVDVPVSCSLGLIGSNGKNATFNFKPKIQTENGAYGSPWAQSTHVNVPASFGTYDTLQFSPLGYKGDSKVTFYLDSFNHTNYYCTRYVNPG